jgi:hypothetical protein
MAIPQLLVVYALATVSGVITFICWFAILFTRRYPRGLFDLVLSFNRWSANVYAYVALLRDEYPPFGGEPGRYPVIYELDYPERLSRWLIFIKWFLSIPHQFALNFLAFIAILVVYPLAWLGILFTGRYPRPFFRFMTGMMRWYWRVNAYSSLLRDEFPPFSMYARSRQRTASKVIYSLAVLVGGVALLIGTVAAFSTVDPQTETVRVSYARVLAGQRTQPVSIEGTRIVLLGADDSYRGAGTPRVGERFVAFRLSVTNRDSLFTSVDERAFRLRDTSGEAYPPEYVQLPGPLSGATELDRGESAEVIAVFAIDSLEDPATLTYSPGFSAFLPFGERVRFVFR